MTLPVAHRQGLLKGGCANSRDQLGAAYAAIPKINFFDRSRKGSILYALADGNKAGTVLNNENV